MTRTRPSELQKFQNSCEPGEGESHRFRFNMINLDVFNRFKPKEEVEALKEPESITAVDRNIERILADEKITPKVTEIAKLLGTIAGLVYSPDTGFRNISSGLSVQLFRKGMVEVMIDTGYYAGTSRTNDKQISAPYLNFEFRFTTEDQPTTLIEVVPELGRHGFAEDIAIVDKEEERFHFLVRKNGDTNEFMTKFRTSTNKTSGLSEAEIIELSKTLKISDFSRTLPPEDMGQRGSHSNARETENPEQVLLNLQAVARRLTEAIRADKR